MDLKEKEFLSSGKSRGYMSGRKDWKIAMLEEAPWIEKCPAHTVYGAMVEADQAYKNVIRLRSRGEAAKLPRCRRKTQKSFFVLGNAVTKNGIYPRLLGKIRSSEPLPSKPCDSRIERECNRWRLVVPYLDKPSNTENQGMCSVDPGVRTFATVFSENGVYKIGHGSFGRIVRLLQHLDNLLSRASKTPCRKKKSMLLAASRARRRIRRLVDDMHYQTIGWLFKNFQTVVFPEGDFTSACKRLGRKISRKSVRSLLGWAFARFRDRLIHKAKCLRRNVMIINEAYTSKTANWTGEIVHNLGGRKTITSNGVSLDRDVNGALGIYLKALLDKPVAIHRYCNC